LALSGRVGDATFGYERRYNQEFYTLTAWKRARRAVILRDLGCDLGIEGYEVHSNLHIHHMNPMTVEDVVNRNPKNLDPEFLIATSLQTHNAIHYGDERQLPRSFAERTPGDTTLW